MLYHIVVQDKKIFQKRPALGGSSTSEAAKPSAAPILQQGITFKKHKKSPKIFGTY